MQSLINQKPYGWKWFLEHIYGCPHKTFKSSSYIEYFVNLHNKLPNISTYLDTHTPFQKLNLRNHILDCPHNNNYSKFCCHGCHYMCQNRYHCRCHRYNCGNCKCHNLNTMKNWAPKNNFFEIFFLFVKMSQTCVYPYEKKKVDMVLYLYVNKMGETWLVISLVLLDQCTSNGFIYFS